MQRIAIITNVIPSYRKAFYEKILGLDKFDITIYCQNELKGFNLSLCHEDFAENTIIVAVLSLSCEKLAWQALPLKKLLQENDIFVFYGNPRVLSNVAWASMFRLFGKKVAVWGQAHTAGATPFFESMRLLWWRLFRNIFVYGDGEVAYLRNKKFTAKNIVGMNNGLDQELIDEVRAVWSPDKLDQWLRDQRLIGKDMLLSCARLEEKNQFQLMLQAMPALIKENPNLLWCVIGEGSEGEKLKNMANELGLQKHVRWIGAIYEEQALAPWFMSAKLMVHPAAIGLSLLHAFGYGLPVLTHNNAEQQMPEFIAMQEGVTGFLYQQSSVQSLQHTIAKALADQSVLTEVGAQALESARNKYNATVMAQRFATFISSMA